jgi:WD repeat-containing protein 61
MTVFLYLSIMKLNKINDLLGHEGAIYALEESFDTNKCYSAGFDNMVVEWDLIEKTNPIAIAKLPSKAFSILKIESLNLLLVGTAQGGVHIIDIKTKVEIKFLLVQTDMIFDLLYLEKKNQLVVVSADGSLAVWNCENWTLIVQKKITTNKLRTCLEINDQLLIGCEDGIIRILDDNFNDINQISTHDTGFGVNTLVISPSKKYLISGSRDGHINFHSLENEYELVKRIPAHNFAVYDIKFSPDNTKFITVSRDKSFKIWDVKTLEVITKVDYKAGGHKASVNAVLWTQNNLIITTGDDRSIKVWRIEK